jgi:GT2 family glycosyltransferase
VPGDPSTGEQSRPDPRVTVVVITHNRRAELARTLGHLARLPEKPAVVVVDNGSNDGSAAYVRWSHPGVQLIAARRNLGAVGRALLSIMAGASVLRVDAFRAAGGFSPRLWLGGEEELLCTDLVTAGYWLCYLPAAIVHHQASLARDATQRRQLGIRNTLWFTWLRRPPRSALRRTAELARTVPRDAASAAAFLAALRGLPWVLRERRPVPAEVEAQIQLLEEPRRASSARRYVG